MPTTNISLRISQVSSSNRQHSVEHVWSESPPTAYVNGLCH